MKELKEENENIRFLSVISYISVLFVVGHFSVEKNNPDLRFHKYQGGVLFGVFSVLYLLDGIILLLLSFSSALQLMIGVILTGAILIANIFLMVFGIQSAVHFEQKLLPFIGPLALTLRTNMDKRRK